MTMTYSLNRSPRRLCEEMEPFIPPVEGERLVRRPFNHYTPALTDWWIVPSLDLPFFKFGKNSAPRCSADSVSPKGWIRCSPRSILPGRGGGC